LFGRVCMRELTAIDWKAVRSEFPALENWVFLNSATFGQLSRQTTQAVSDHFIHRDETACADFLSWFDDADHMRSSVAQLIQCSADDIAFVHNASTALALMISGIEWTAGDRIVSLRDDFPNNLYFPAHLAARGVEFVEAAWDDFYAAVNDRTRLVLMSTVNYSTGLRPDLAAVSRHVHAHGGLLYVDGTQSVGALEFRVPDVRPDMLAVHGYKWLLSPNGAGFMYVSPSLRRVLQPNSNLMSSDGGVTAGGARSTNFITVRRNFWRPRRNTRAGCSTFRHCMGWVRPSILCCRWGPASLKNA
jgi:cysteine desulfurase / selenocysteine lyase